jgi:hypothetical protein
MAKFVVPCSWRVGADPVIEASSIDEAIEKMNNMSVSEIMAADPRSIEVESIDRDDNLGRAFLPGDPYLDGSMEIDPDYVEEV